MPMTTKALTVVEMDVELFRSTTFETTKIGQTPTGWTSRWHPSGTMTGVANPTLPAGRGVRCTPPGRWSLYTMDRLPVLAQSEIRIMGVQMSASDPFGVISKGSGAESSEQGYMVQYYQGNAILYYITGGVVIRDLTRVTLPSDPGDPIWIVLNTSHISGGVSLRMKCWVGSIDDEPSEYMASAEDTTTAIMSAGWAGIYVGAAGEDGVDIGYFSVRALYRTEMETLRFAQPTEYLPIEFDAIPSIRSVGLSPGSVALGESLGTRGGMTVIFSDHKHADYGEGFDRGTYWGKFRARQPYLENSKIRLMRGYLGQPLSEFETKHYVVQGFDGPTPDGTFTVKAQDPLKLADGDRSQAPVLSRGFLVGDIDDDSGSATLAPAGIGNLEYPSSGYLSIGGKEIVAFTRSGNNLTLTERGAFGTEPQDHNADDRCQLCLVYTAQKASYILSNLLENYAGIDPAYIPHQSWETEVDTYLQRLYTRCIPEPTRVDTLVNQLIKQAGLAVGWDDERQLIRMQVLRGVPLNQTTFTEDVILQGTLRTKEQPERRLSQVWVSFGLLNPLDATDDPNNYRSTVAVVDSEAELRYGAARIEKIYAPWIPAFGRDAATRASYLHLGRFATPPRKFSFDVAKNSGLEASLLDGFRIKWRSDQNEMGSVVDMGSPIQITRRSTASDRIQLEAEEMLFKQFDPISLTDRVIVIDSNINNVNLRQLHDSIYPQITAQDIADGVNLLVIINTGVTVGSNGETGSNALHVGSWPAGFPIRIELYGRIEGAGGHGGHGGGWGTPGANGGTALYTRFPITMEYKPGARIWGGGGGGGGGGYVNAAGANAGGGGGGAGAAPGLGGQGYQHGGHGGNGTPTSGGSGGSGLRVNPAACRGGEGGGPGQPGIRGYQHTSTNPSNGVGGAGGAAGLAVNGNSYITKISPGNCDFRGGQVN